MPAAIDVTGMKWGRLTALRYERSEKERRLWSFKCDCGAIVELPVGAVVRGNTRSCGCLCSEINGARMRRVNYRHGYRATPEYATWSSMLQRCHNPKAQAYQNYGARGIVVCETWRASFVSFLADVGERPSPDLELDRIDNDGPYCKENCRWTTRSVNIKNSRPRMRNAKGQFGPLLDAL